MYQITTMLTQAEENYIKAIFKIAEKEIKSVSTNSISKLLKTTAASVTDMLKRLSEKELVNYVKYRGVHLTEIGNQIATELIRKHRLWEVFLCERLKFKWDEVHEIAEQLEHIHSETLVNRLDEFLGFPKFDPHGDPIPNSEGRFTLRNQIVLADMKTSDAGVLIGVKTQDKPFLQYLDEIKLGLGTELKITHINDYDFSVTVYMGNGEKHVISSKVAKNLICKKIIL